MLTLVLLYLLLIAPVRLCAVYDHGLTLTLRIWGLGGTIPFSLPSGGDGDITQPRLLRIISAVLRIKRARGFLHRHTTLVSLQVLLRLSLYDAAHTAVLTGLLRQLARMLPHKTDVRVQPEFLSDTRLQLRCIVFFRLGTIIITAAMALAACLLEKRRRHTPYPKEA